MNMLSLKQMSMLFILSAITNFVHADQHDKFYTLLFVGNSLTYSNDLPKLVKQYANSKGIKVKTVDISKPNYAIVDHWAKGQVQGLIKSKKYDFVILQQGPSSQADGLEMLVNGGAPYAKLTEANGAQLAYFMVWPSRRYYHTFPGVINNYTQGAEANNAILLPVGSFWKKYIAATGDYSYYGSDGFHPSKAGSQKAAEIIVEKLFSNPVCNCIQQQIQ